ncbi:MAG: GGDEF domain-containing response regulator [Rhodospirillaceae bacterium]
MILQNLLTPAPERRTPGLHDDRRQARLLVVEDSELDRTLLADVIAEIGTITFANSAQEARACFEMGDFDVVILDILLPDASGFALCQEMRENGQHPDVPIIILTSLDDDQSEQQGLTIGASDYITKPFSPAVVRTRILNQIALYRKTRDVKVAYEKLMLLAATDDLTGVFNRRQFTILAEQKLKEVTGQTGQASLLLLDIDHFKQINDSFGHDAGDATLVAFAKLWTDALRPGDFIGRIGGEEFACFLPDTSIDAAGDIAHRLCTKTEQAVVSCPPNSIRATVSIGVAAATETATDLAKIMKNADKALYQAKKEGRNMVVVR